MKCGVVTLGQIKATGRWDVAFNLEYAARKEVCDKLVEKFTKDELVDMIEKLPFEDRRLFNALVSSRYDVPVNVRHSHNLSHAAAAVYLAVIYEQHDVSEATKKMLAEVEEHIGVIEGVDKKLKEVLTDETRKT
jgi:hypothetical protein